MSRYICIHGHFYQPPRENPWLEEVERQDSAYPYHDWNERVTAECYAPNSSARILGPHGKIAQIISNYSNMSFNFGPTLLSWMARKEPEAYQAIIKSDRISREKFGGHGSAIAQAYNHMILPLANRRDKETQVIWGLRDFEYHFRRPAEGMWLPETAVDIETLEVLAQYGVKFTILAPHQAKAFRKIGSTKWQNVETDGFNPRRPYTCVLPSGQIITIFFYDGPISQGVAFDRVLDNGENFAHRLLSAFTNDKEEQLVHIATDGETYGHHHKLGDMGLAYCLNFLEKQHHAKLTIYGEYLEKHPPEYEVTIHENSSWSCVHGIERWRSDCGCNVGHQAGWNQKWREPLRRALDWLRDKAIDMYQTEMPQLANSDIWEIRNAYISPILDRSPENLKHFFSRLAKPNLSEIDQSRFLKFLEMQRHAMLMYTSCGWFFDDISGIETVQIMSYASRVIQIINDMTKVSLEDEFLKLLEVAPSNVLEHKNARAIYENEVRPLVLDLPRVGAHYAISSLFEDYKDQEDLFCFKIQKEFYDFMDLGKQKLAFGKILITSIITRRKEEVSYVVLHLGDHNFIGGAGASMDDSRFAAMHSEVKATFKKGDLPLTIKMIEKYFDVQYSLWHLFKDEQTKILYRVLDSSLEEIQNSLRQINEHHYPIIQVIRQMGIPLPKVLANTFLVTINSDLLHAVASNPPDFQRLSELVHDIKKWSLEIDWVTVEFVVRKRLNDLMLEFQLSPEKEETVLIMNLFFSVLHPLSSLKIDLWKMQNIYFSITQSQLQTMQFNAKHGDTFAARWVDQFKQLGNHLNVFIP